MKCHLLLEPAGRIFLVRSRFGHFDCGEFRQGDHVRPLFGVRRFITAFCLRFSVRHFSVEASALFASPWFSSYSSLLLIPSQAVRLVQLECEGKNRRGAKSAEEERVSHHQFLNLCALRVSVVPRLLSILRKVPCPVRATILDEILMSGGHSPSLSI